MICHSANMILWPPLLVLCLLHVGNCWTTEDLELFDLVESTPKTFYQVLGVDEKASNTDIRKAYRKLSTVLHPDRNKNENAEEEFRQVAAVADVLRNEERRKTYDLILKMGLPDWRTPIYYYRRARNMGLYELTIFLFCLATLAQYIFLWTAYWEKKYEIEEVVLSRIRKKSKHQRKGQKECQNAKIEEDILVSEAMSILKRPSCGDLFPVRLFHFTIHLIKSSPSYVAGCINYFKTSTTNNIKRKLSKEEEEVPRVKVRKQVVKPTIPDYSNIPEYETSATEDSTSKNGDQIKKNGIKKISWAVESLTEHQILEFKKALKKFPVGTLQRWEKVAVHLDCSVSEVTVMVKEMKNNQFSKAVPLSRQGVTGTEKENFGSEMYEEKDKKPTKPLANGANCSQGTEAFESDLQKNGKVVNQNGVNGNSDTFWKQEEQQSLEIALKKFPKDTPARWEKVSEFISTKTKEECVERYKILVQQVKKKKHKEV
ncbi:hypothetical protein JTE90_027354 [Oedothorax gibbosus]|uniref:Uncharacterized protein n=1 Tax=Oedothorax gibbosus TaxID=931172 RepID=A0AAV6W2K4_9ARAC|nr:hypothetical protein JTE90_027354 [Oedothorax gibbosus]